MSHKILFLKFLKINSKVATASAPYKRKIKVPCNPNAIYLLKMCIIKIGLRSPIIVIKRVKSNIVPNELLFFNI